MEQPIEAFRRWWGELEKYEEARNNVDWLFESVILPHFYPQKKLEYAEWA